MEAYSIIMTVFVFSLLFVLCILIRQKERERGQLIWSDQLKPGGYKVMAKSPCGTFAILKADEYNFVGLRTCGEMPEVGKIFQWNIKKLKGYEGEAVLVENEDLFSPE